MSHGRTGRVVTAPLLCAVLFLFGMAGCSDGSEGVPSASSSPPTSPDGAEATDVATTDSPPPTTGAAPGPPEAGACPGTLEWDGRERSYLVHVPAGLDAREPVPLVVLLHGGGGEGSRIAGFAGFDTLGQSEGFLVVTPDGVEGNWNDGRETNVEAAHRLQVDDVGFLQTLVADLAGRLPVDRDRVYATGISNGALMSARLACDAAGTFAAVGLVAGTAAVPVSEGCEPGRPVPLIGFFGTADPLVPYEGGGIRDLQGRPNRGAIVGVEDLATGWASRNGCAEAEEQALPDTDPDDGSTVTLDTWSGCDLDAAVEVYRVDGGGHTWPGRAQYLPVDVIGGVNRDIDATALMWRFFSSHPRSGL